MKGLNKRILTAIVFVIVMVSGIYWNKMSFALLFGLITLLALWEFHGLVLDKNNLTRRTIATIIGALPYIFATGITFGQSKWSTLFILLLTPLAFVAFLYELALAKQSQSQVQLDQFNNAIAYKPNASAFQNLGYIALGMLYIGMPFAMLIYVLFNGVGFHTNIAMGLLLFTWINDTGAYFTGSIFGKTPFYPAISPKKTWEGTIGGLLFVLLLAGILSRYFFELELSEWLILGLIVAVFGSLGDLVESMLKRGLHIKDSGTLLPGHGGILDRFDAFIFMLPFACFYLWVFTHS